MNIMTIMAAVIILLNSAPVYCDGGPSYGDTVSLIKNLMAGKTSEARKESYNYVRFDQCRLEYNVLGTFPAGGLYDIKYSGLDFSTLNYGVSKAGHDYTAFIILNFGSTLHAKDRDRDLTIRTVVVNVSDDENAQILYRAFLHLGELCGAPKSPQ